ncbi:hypothetical protein V6N13_067277 [Hibiscus sabdariffa]|uniref:Uncharacterized protein n=1 Tax=Hibiscus sabdariffa TaxID=183260 RepID=A0ABR2DSX7_9ROSI
MQRWRSVVKTGKDGAEKGGFGADLFLLGFGFGVGVGVEGRRRGQGGETSVGSGVLGGAGVGFPHEGNSNGSPAIVDPGRRISHGCFLGQEPAEELVILLDLETSLALWLHFKVARHSGNW